jgi:hypothetical protein
MLIALLRIHHASRDSLAIARSQVQTDQDKAGSLLA